MPQLPSQENSQENKTNVVKCQNYHYRDTVLVMEVRICCSSKQPQGFNDWAKRRLIAFLHHFLCGYSHFSMKTILHMAPWLTRTLEFQLPQSFTLLNLWSQLIWEGKRRWRILKCLNAFAWKWHSFLFVKHTGRGT